MRQDDLEQRGQTEAVFREVNERIAEYEEVRADPATFMVLPATTTSRSSGSSRCAAGSLSSTA